MSAHNEPPRVLVVEDELFCRRFLEMTLETHHVELELCPDGASALAAVESFRPDLILVDLMLPDMDGVSLIGKLRRHPDFARVPIVVTTSLDDRFSSIEAREAGANGYLVKPLLPEQVSALLIRHLGPLAA